MLSDDMMGYLTIFLLDFDYGFNWQDILNRAGGELSQTSWKRYVEEYDRSLPRRKRPAPPRLQVSMIGSTEPNDHDTLHAWVTRVKRQMKERTGVMYFTAIEILITYAAHDVRHDLESFFWLLVWVVLRYTQTTCWSPNRTYRSVFGEEVEEESAKDKIFCLVESIDWEVVGNKPLATLFLKFKDLCEMAMPYTKPTPIPLTYESVLTLLHEALASMAWPQNDRALPFKMPPEAVPFASHVGSQAVTGSSGGEERQAVLDEVDPLSLPAHKRAHVYRPPTDYPNNGASGV